MFPLYFPYRTSPCAIRFHLNSTGTLLCQANCCVWICTEMLCQHTNFIVSDVMINLHFHTLENLSPRPLLLPGRQHFGAVINTCPQPRKADTSCLLACSTSRSLSPCQQGIFPEGWIFFKKITPPHRVYLCLRL